MIVHELHPRRQRYIDITTDLTLLLLPTIHPSKTIVWWWFGCSRNQQTERDFTPPFPSHIHALVPHITRKSWPQLAVVVLLQYTESSDDGQYPTTTNNR
jgi:hypothetical protein